MILFPDTRETLLEMLPRGGNVCEIGVALGDFSQVIWDTCQPIKFHLIDPWEYQPREDYQADGNNVPDDIAQKRYQSVKKRFKQPIENNRIQVHRNFSHDIANQFPDGYFSWIYVDAVHSYEGVLSDLRTYASKVASDGFILGHDFANHQGAEEYGFGVVQAVIDFCKESDFDFCYLTQENYPSYLLTRKPESRQAKNIKTAILKNYYRVVELENFIEDFDFKLNLIPFADHERIRGCFHEYKFAAKKNDNKDKNNA